MEQGYISLADYWLAHMQTSSDAYYKSALDLGENGDFTTAPEISQLFAEMIAIWAVTTWQQIGKPPCFTLLELGPGTGRLMSGILGAAASICPEFYAAANIALYDINPYFIKKQRQAMAAHANKISHIDNLKNLASQPHIIIGNEFFDALPVSQYQKIEGQWHEIVIKKQDNKLYFANVEINRDMQKMLLAKYSSAPGKSIVEISKQSIQIASLLAGHIAKRGGAALIIDYGYNIPPSARDKNQYSTTLQSIKNHKYSSLLDADPGDISAHVDFFEIEQQFKNFENLNCKFQSQRDFLLKHGIQIRSQILQKQNPPLSRIIKNQEIRLTDNAAMGQLFKVLSAVNYPKTSCRL